MFENEINITSKQKPIINMGSDQEIIINKLFGPLDFCSIRITPVSKTCTWKIEKEIIHQNNSIEWVTVFEFEGQDDNDEDDEN